MAHSIYELAVPLTLLLLTRMIIAISELASDKISWLILFIVLRRGFSSIGITGTSCLENYAEIFVLEDSLKQVFAL